MSSTLSNAIKPTHCIFYLSYYILLSLCFPHFKNSGVVLLHSLNINILRMFILHPYYIILLSEDPGGLPLWALAYKGLVSMHVFFKFGLSRLNPQEFCAAWVERASFKREFVFASAKQAHILPTRDLLNYSFTHFQGYNGSINFNYTLA